MKKLLGSLLTIIMLLTAGLSFAHDVTYFDDARFYLKGIGKYVMATNPTVDGITNLKAKNGWGYGAAVGAQLDQFRAEFEIARQVTSLEDGMGELRPVTYMVNGFFDMPIYESFGLYGMAGVGYARTNVNLTFREDTSAGGFAWKGGVGAFYNINSNMAVDFGWEYLGLDDTSINNNDVSNLNSNNLVAAFRYTF